MLHDHKPQESIVTEPVRQAEEVEYFRNLNGNHQITTGTDLLPGAPEEAFAYLDNTLGTQRATFAERCISYESPKSPEHLARLNTIFNAAVAYGNTLGVDLRHRLPSTDEVHFFGSQESFARAVAESGSPESPFNYAAASPAIGLLMRYKSEHEIFPDTPDDDYSILHELFHFVGVRNLQIIPTATGLTINYESGYIRPTGHSDKPHMGQVVEETATDFSALLAGRFIHPEWYVSGSYGQVNAIMAAIINKTSKTSDQAPEAIVREFTRGRLTTDAPTSLRTLFSALSSDQFIALASFPTDYSGTDEKLVGLARSLDVASCESAIRELGEGTFKGSVAPWL